MIDIVSIQNHLERDLETAVAEANRAFSGERVIANIDSVVKRRTAKGQFLEGSSTKGYSRGHAKEREKKGLGTKKVDLFFSGEMLSATRGEVEADGTGLTIRYGYLAESEADATRIAEYHNVLGAGKAKVIRRFLGLTGDEETKIVENAQRDYGKTLKKAIG